MSTVNVFLQEFLMISNTKTVVSLLCLLGLFVVVGILARKKVSFTVRVFIAMVLGLLLGLGLQLAAGFPDNPLDVLFVAEATQWYSLFGNGYMSLIRMLVVPLVMVSIIQVFVTMEDGATLGKMVRTGVGVTMIMVIVSAIVGLAVGLLLNVGKGMALTQGTSEMREVTSLISTLQGLIPSNPVQAMVDVNVIALVIFSLFIAMGTRRMAARNPKEIQPFIDLINALHKIIISVTMTIIKLMPFAIVPLLANTIAIRGLASLKDVGIFVLALYLAVAIMFVLQLVVLSLFGIRPTAFLKKGLHVLMLAFTSRSSMGTLPVTVETLTHAMGVNPGTANFVASFGTTAGMQGCAGVFPALLIVFVCNLNGIPVDVTMIVMSVIVVTLGSLGIAGIPGTATMAASISLSGTGLGAYYPLISPILAIDPLIDMGRTFLNVSGSMVNALVTDTLLGQHNKKSLYDPALIVSDSQQLD